MSNLVIPTHAFSVGLLEALQSETPTSNEGDASPTSLGLTGYEPPSESALLADSLVDPVRTLPITIQNARSTSVCLDLVAGLLRFQVELLY